MHVNKMGGLQFSVPVWSSTMRSTCLEKPTELVDQITFGSNEQKSYKGKTYQGRFIKHLENEYGTLEEDEAAKLNWHERLTAYFSVDNLKEGANAFKKNWQDFWHDSLNKDLKEVGWDSLWDYLGAIADISAAVLSWGLSIPVQMYWPITTLSSFSGSFVYGVHINAMEKKQAQAAEAGAS